MSDRVLYEVGDDGVAVVTINRPEKRNALDDVAFKGLREAARQAQHAVDDGRCRAVLLQGAGPAFSSGIDVTILGSQVGTAPSDAWIAELQDAFTAYEDLTVPTVAAVKGPTFGAGCQLAIACHLRVAAPDAELGVLEARWGLVPDLGGTYRLPRLVGLSRAVDMAASARCVDAETALRWGLVDAVLPVHGFDDAARAYAARLAAGPTVAIGNVARLMRDALTSSRGDALAAERAHQQRCLASEDFGEAVTAAAQRRDPSFKGR